MKRKYDNLLDSFPLAELITDGLPKLSVHDVEIHQAGIIAQLPDGERITHKRFYCKAVVIEPSLFWESKQNYLFPEVVIKNLEGGKDRKLSNATLQYIENNQITGKIDIVLEAFALE